MLNLIDHLPRHSFYSQAVMDDPEHMEMLERVKTTGDPGPAPLPPLAWWTAEVDSLATVNDTLLELKDVLVRVNVDKSKQSSLPPITRTPRPGRQKQGEQQSATRLTKAEQEARHARNVARLLPGKARPTD